MTKKLIMAIAGAGLLGTSVAQSVAPQRRPVSEGGIVRAAGSVRADEGVRVRRPGTFQADLARQATHKAEISKASPAGVPRIFGAVCSSTNLSKGVYELPGESGGTFVKQPLERASDVVDGSKGAVRQGQYYYSMKFEEYDWWPGNGTYYIDSWEIREDGWVHRYSREAEAYECGTAFATDPATNIVYGSMPDASETGYELCTIEYPRYKNGSLIRTVAGSLEQPLYAMAIGTDGMLYALRGDGQLVSVAKDTGENTVIGPTGLSLTGMGGATIDTTTGKLYCTASLSDGTSGLYEIDKATGAATLLYAFAGNEQVTGLYCIPSEAAPAAPGKVTGLTAEFPGGSLEGTVSFTAPQTDSEGKPAQGSLTYTVTLGGSVLANGQTEYGATVNAAVTLPAEGEHELTVVTANEAGAGEGATLKVRAGKGLPKAPAVSASWDGEKMQVSWEAVTESADGLYLDPAEVTYKVTRYPGEVTVAEQTKETSVMDNPGKPSKFTIYHYEVEATYAGKTSAPGRSESVGVGAYTVPYTQDFGAEFYRDDLIESFTIVDANEDGEGWAYNSYTEVMRCRTMQAANGADDWLILPAITLEQGVAYELSAKMHDGGETLKERVEVKMGRKNSPEAMTLTLLPEQLVESAEFKEYKAYVNPTESGDWYIGFHCTTPGSEYYLYLDDISLTAKADAGLAQAPSEFTVTPDENGLHKATISLKAPVLDVSGNPLGSIDKITISRDGTEIHAIEGPTPGGTYTYEDNGADCGNHDYSAVAWNRSGAGDAASVTAFVGFHKPAHPAWATATETDKDGEVHMTWATVSTDENGKSLPEEEITYSVVRLSQNADISEIIAEGLRTTEHTFNAVDPGTQAFINFAVFAETEGGHSKGAIAPQIITGTPYALPYRESFENEGLPSSQFSMATVEGYGYWESMSDDTFPDMKSHDHDTGYIAMAATAEGDRASLTSAKISLKDAVNPVLSFYVYNMAGDWGRDDNEIEVEIGVKGDFTSVYSKANYETGASDQWNLVAIPLNDYAGQDIQVRLTATCRHASYTVVDEMEVKPWAPYDLRGVGFTSPARLVANEPVRIVAEVENIGLNRAEGGAVVLYANENAYMRQELPALEPGKSARVVFDTKINPSFGKEVSLHVKTDLYEDVNTGNDRSAAQVLELEQTLLPCPTTLEATKNGDGTLSLSWQAPDMGQATAARVTEDFESSEAWKSEVTDWTFLDLDQKGINGFDGVTFPGIPDGSRQSFWVMDDRLEDLNNTFAAASGNQYLANMNVTEGATDDWAISPRLCGKEHILSFMAKSYNWMYPETFYVLYSSDGTEPDDFVDLKEFYQIPWDWTEYSVTLPEGTTHFAIRSNTGDGVMLFIDDVSFVPAGTAEELELKGYNVYCDGIAMNAAPVKEASYVSGGYNPEGHTYTVTALYDKGESGPANVLLPSGIGTAEAEGVSISAVEGLILVSGADGERVSVSRMDGVSLYSGTANGPVKVAAQPGIYVVKAGRTARKVTMR